MLSEKEVMELTERAMGHISLIEKFGVYAQQCSDPQVRDILMRHQQILQNHFQTLTGFVQSTQSQIGTTGNQMPMRPLSQ